MCVEGAFDVPPSTEVLVSVSEVKQVHVGNGVLCLEFGTDGRIEHGAKIASKIGLEEPNQ